MNTSNEQIPLRTPAETAADYPLNFAEAPLTERETPAANPDNPPWGVLLAFGLWILSILLVSLIPLIFVMPYLLVRYPGLKNMPQSLFADQTATLLSVLGIIPAHLLTLAAVWLVVKRLSKQPFLHTFGWSWSERFGFWPSAGLAFALFLLGTAVAKLLGGDAPTDLDLIINSSTTVRITLALLAVATGPFVEELIYRGVMFPAIQRAIGTTWSVVLVSLLFALVHVAQYKNNVGVITAVLLLSITLTLVRAWTGRLLPCFIIHMVFNGIQSLIIVFAPYIEQFEKGAEQKTALVLTLGRALQTLA